MELFLLGLAPLSITVNRAMEIFKTWLDRYADLAPETRKAVLVTAQFVIGIAVMGIGYFTADSISPVVTGVAWLDRYPVAVILFGGSVLGFGGDVLFQLLEIAKRLKGPGAVG